jgi:hypothetical protein
MFMDDNRETDVTIVFEAESERSLIFRGKEIATADLKDGHGYVSVRSLCEAFGLDQRAQRRRLQRQQSYFEPYTATIRMTTPGGPQPTLCLMASAVPLFLTGVELERVQDPEAREYLQAFLDEAHIVLAEHFNISERGEMQFLQQSLARMIAEQETFEEQLRKKVDEEVAALRKSQEEKVQQIREAFSGLRSDIRRIEQYAGPKPRLSPEQKGQIREAVATLGQLMIENGVLKPYPGIYMDVTRMSGVSKVEDIRQEDFLSVMDFLNGQVQVFLEKKKSAEKDKMS